MNYLGIDCGGTNLRVGLVTETGKLVQKWKVPSPLKSNPQSFAEIVKGLLEDEILEDNIDGIGIGVPGPLDLKQGLILVSANLGNKTPIKVMAQFESVFNTKVYLDRDTIVALLGEQWVGAAKDCQNVVMLTLGTGVGGAMMVSGEIERGIGGKAGEIGHMIIQIQNSKFKSQNLPKCGLGHEGCLEALINSTDDIDEIATYLGIGLANIVDIFNPEKIIIGGGKVIFSSENHHFLPKAIEIMREKGIKPAVDEVIVEYAKLGEWSGVYGAAKLCVNDHN